MCLRFAHSPAAACHSYRRGTLLTLKSPIKTKLHVYTVIIAITPRDWLRPFGDSSVSSSHHMTTVATTTTTNFASAISITYLLHTDNEMLRQCSRGSPQGRLNRLVGELIFVAPSRRSLSTD